MAGEAVEALDLGFHFVRFSEDVNRVDAGADHRAERVVGAVADEQDKVVRVADVVFQVVPDAARLAHAA